MNELDLRRRLEGSLPPGQVALLKWIAEQAAAAGSALYIVGGFVRDLILGSPSLDFDFVVEGDAIQLARQLSRRYGGHVHSHRRFGTAKWILGEDRSKLRQALEFEDRELPERLDFVSARSESYERPTALPSVAQGDIEGDLRRRDFSINALALRLDEPHYGELLDVENGMQDLQHKRIRVLHAGSFEDDPTRALRAVRLEQRLGFEIEPQTRELMERALPLIAEVSGERIRSELEVTFRESQLGKIMARLHQLGLLQAVHPSLSWDDWLESRFAAATGWEAPDEWRLEAAPPVEQLLYALWVYRLPAAQAESVCRRLRLSQKERAVAMLAGRFGCDLAEPPQPSRLTRCLHSAPEAALVATWLALEGEPAARQAIERYLAAWRWVEPTVDGHQLQEMGLPPGPAYRQILQRLRDAWLDGEVNNVAQEAELLAELAAGVSQDG